MVALYLSNTKKILIGCSISLLIYPFNFQVNQGEVESCKEASDYLELKVGLKAEVNFNDVLELKIRYKNISSDTVEFYPHALLYLAKPSPGFSYKSKMLNKKIDVTKVARLSPKERYSIDLSTNVDSAFFDPGSNKLILAYSVKELKDEHEKYNKLCGHLETEEFTLIVNK